REVAHTIVALDETNLRVEVLPDAAAFGDEIYEIRAIAHRAACIVLPATQPWRACQDSKAGQYQVFVNDESSVQSAGLVVRISRITGTLVHIHRTDVGLAKERALDPAYAVVRLRIWTLGTCADVKQTEIETGQLPRDFSAAINPDFLSRNRINADLSAEEEAVGFASEWKFEHSRIFKKELPFFRKEEFVGREIELNDVYIGIGKVSVGGEVRNKIRTNKALEIQTPDKVARRDNAQSRKRNCHRCRPAEIRPPCSGGPNPVP